MVENYIYQIPKDAIGPTLIDIAEKNEKLVVMSSDVSVSCNVEIFNQRFPQRFFEMGIAEQSTMSVSGGLATEGFIPVYVALAIFSCGMTWPQTRQICNADLNVKIIGTHAGVDDGQDGSGHHATEDIAISRVLPRMTVLCPSDINEVASAIRQMVLIEGPVYMRVARENQPIIHKVNCDFQIGMAETIYDNGNDFAIIYEGTALKEALDGWKLLQESGAMGKLVSIRSIKPLDEETVRKIADMVNVIITVENHSIVGGLYSTICEKLAGEKHKAVIKPIGFSDVFMQSGESSDIKKQYGLSGECIFKEYQRIIHMGD